MSQMDGTAISVPDATDTGIPSEPIKPDYGRSATLSNQRGMMIYDNRSLAAMFQTILEDAERYRLPFEQEWLKAFNQYHGATMDAGKAPWQSLVHVPMSKRDVDTIASRLVSIVFSEQDWFGVEPEGRYQDKLANIAKKVIQYQLHRGKFREPVETSFKDALICGNGPIKITYDRALKPWMNSQFIPGAVTENFGVRQQGAGHYEMRRALKMISRLRFEPIIPTDFWLDPSGQNRFVIQRIKRHVSDLWKLTEDQLDPVTQEVLVKAVYDRAEVDKVRPGARDRLLDNYAAQIRRERPQAYGDMTVDLYEFWGDFYDPSNGATIFRNCVITFCDKQWCLRRPEENPFYHQDVPYLLARPMLNPHQVYGYGFLMQTAKIQDEMDRTLQVMIDKMHLSVPMVEADISAARNPEEFGGDHLKVSPARIITKKSGDRKIFTPVEGFTPPTEWEVQVYRLLQEAFGMDTSVNEYSAAGTESTNRKTKAEVEIKVSASQNAFNAVGQYMEEHFLSPMVKMIYELSIQFEQGFTSPRLMRMFGDDTEAQQILMALSAMPLAERWENMNLDAEFRVDGVTLQVTRQQRLDRLMNFLKIMGGDPQMVTLIDKRELLRDLLILFDLPKTMVLQQSDAMLQAAEQAVIAQFAMAMSGQGQPGQPPGAPPGGQPPGAPPGPPPPNPNNSRVAAAAQAKKGAEDSQARAPHPA